MRFHPLLQFLPRPSQLAAFTGVLVEEFGAAVRFRCFSLGLLATARGEEGVPYLGGFSFGEEGVGEVGEGEEIGF